MSLQILDYSLKNFKIPGFPQYDPLFGTIKDEGEGLHSKEILQNEMMPFVKQRSINGEPLNENEEPPIGIISQDSFATPIEFNATFAVDEGVILQLEEPSYEGQEITIVASFDLGSPAKIVTNISKTPIENLLNAKETCKFIAANGSWKIFKAEAKSTESIEIHPYAYYTGDELPEIPDNLGNALYFKDNWNSSMDYWRAGSGSIVEVVNGNLKVTKPDGNEIGGIVFDFLNIDINDNIVNRSKGKIVIIKLAENTIISTWYIRDTQALIETYHLFENPQYNYTYLGNNIHCAIIPSPSATLRDMCLNIYSGGSALEWIYIGDASYSTSIIDNSGNGRHMDIIKGVVPITEPDGRKALKFLGMDGGGAISREPFYPTGDFSISFWAKANTTENLPNDQMIIGNAESGGMAFKINPTGELKYCFSSNGAYQYGQYIVIPDKTWLHYIIKYNSDSKNVILKINNEIKDNYTLPDNIVWPSSSVPLAFGNDPSTYGPSVLKTQAYTGLLSDVAIFDHLTTEEEDTFLFNNKFPKKAVSAESIVSQGDSVESHLFPKPPIPYAYWIGDNLPQLPDSPVGVNYRSDFSSGVDGWTGNAVSLQASNGKLKITVTASDPFILCDKIATTNIQGKVIIFKLSGNYYLEFALLHLDTTFSTFYSITKTNINLRILDNGVFAISVPNDKPYYKFRIDCQQNSPIIGTVLYLDYCYIGDAQYTTGLFDNSGNGNHLETAKSVITTTGPKGGKALFFIGTGGIQGKRIWQPSGSFTFALWTKFDKSKFGATYYTFISSYSNVASSGIVLRTSNDFTFLTLATSIDKITAELIQYPLANIPNNTWIHIIAKYDTYKNKLILKINNIEVGSLILSGPIPWPGLPLALGSNPLIGNPFIGYISDAAVFNYATTEEEDKYLYTKSLTKNPISGDVVIEKWVSSDQSMFYRKYASGWVEQGSLKNVQQTSGDVTSISLPVPMLNSSYNVNATIQSTTASSTQLLVKVHSVTTTTLQIGVIFNGAYNPFYGFYWMVSGFKA